MAARTEGIVPDPGFPPSAMDASSPKPGAAISPARWYPHKLVAPPHSLAAMP